MKNKHFFILALSIAFSIATAPSIAGKKEEMSLKKSRKICETAYPMNVEGCALSFSSSYGNCLACHQIKNGAQFGNIAPPLVVMKARFPDKDALRMQIWDASLKNPNSSMPPFGRHKILTADQIDQVTNFIYKL